MMRAPRHLLVAAMLLGLGACAALRPAPPIERDAAYRLDRGLAALDAEEYREAFDELSWVYSHCTGHARGAEALVALAALELDPRNPAGRPGVAADMLGRVIREPAPRDYIRPMAETAYLMALSLGAPPAAVAEQGAPAAVPGDTAPPRQPATTAAPAQQPAQAAGDTADAPRGSGAVEPSRAAAVLQPVSQEPAYGCGAVVEAEGWVAPRLPELPGRPLVALLRDAERARAASAGDAAALRQELATVQARLAETEAELERIRKTLRP